MARFGQGDYEERVTHLIAPTIAQLAKAISEKHWKPLNYQVRQGLRPLSASGGHRLEGAFSVGLAVQDSPYWRNPAVTVGCAAWIMRIDPKCADFKSSFGFKTNDTM